MRTAFRFAASLTALAVVVQVGLAGYGSFNAIDKAGKGASITKHQIENGYDPHGVVGTIVLALLLLLLILALAARHKVKVTAILFALGIVQMLLAWGGTGAAWVGFFHGVNALAIAAVAGAISGNEWRAARVASAV